MVTRLSLLLPQSEEVTACEYLACDGRGIIVWPSGIIRFDSHKSKLMCRQEAGEQRVGSAGAVGSTKGYDYSHQGSILVAGNVLNHWLSVVKHFSERNDQVRLLLLVLWVNYLHIFMWKPLFCAFVEIAMTTWLWQGYRVAFPFKSLL